MLGNTNALGNKGGPRSPAQTEECQKELASSWRPNKNGAGYACISCYNHFGASQKVKAEADPEQLAITQFFKKQ
jgi:hypothetical protein